MKNISYWALMHPVKSITIIVVCQMLLSAIAIYSGVWLFAQNVILPMFVFYISMTLFFAALIFYPIRRARHDIWKYSFVKQKSMDLLLVVSFTLASIAMSNSDANSAWHSTDEDSRARLVVLKSEQSIAPAAEKTWSKKVIRKELKKQFKTFVADMKMNTGKSSNNFLGIAATVFLMIILMSVVAGLACAAGCSGGGVAGMLLILVIGWGITLWVGISLWRSLKGKRKTKYEPMPQKE